MNYKIRYNSSNLIFFFKPLIINSSFKHCRKMSFKQLINIEKIIMIISINIPQL